MCAKCLKFVSLEEVHASAYCIIFSIGLNFFLNFFFFIKSVRKGNVSYLNKTDLDPT